MEFPVSSLLFLTGLMHQSTVQASQLAGERMVEERSPIVLTELTRSVVPYGLSLSSPTSSRTPAHDIGVVVIVVPNALLSLALEFLITSFSSSSSPPPPPPPPPPPSPPPPPPPLSSNNINNNNNNVLHFRRDNLRTDRYVDDTPVVIDRDELLTFKERLNAVFPDLQFTIEEEENNQLAFLDVLVCRKDCGGLKTKVFRKATNAIQVLNFNSNHPINHKRRLYQRQEGAENARLPDKCYVPSLAASLSRRCAQTTDSRFLCSSRVLIAYVCYQSNILDSVFMAQR
ncbi:hypothetical protein SprV_0301296600 [Sparganum proliferum]